MKIYLVMVENQEAIDIIDAALDTDEPLYIVTGGSHGRIAGIQEYVNVDSP